MSSDRLIPLGEYHIGACRRTSATAAVGAAFQPVQDELKLRKRTREEAELAMIAPRVTVRFTEFDLEKAIRGVVFAAQTLDGVADGGTIKTALVPEGIERYTRPRGAAQKTVAEDFLRRLTKQPEAAPLVAQHRPLVEAALTTFNDALNARLLAATQLAEARAHEDGAREAWVSAYTGNAGAIQGIFKKRRAERELYFDRFRASTSTETDAEGDEDDEDESGPVAAG
jgi:hypothetical protein